MTKINAIPVALLERSLRICREEPSCFKYSKSFETILDWWRSDQIADVIEAAIADGDLPADWYASSSEWPEPVPLDAFSAPDPRAGGLSDAAREDLATLRDGLEALGALAAMILRISEKMEGATT